SLRPVYGYLVSAIVPLLGWFGAPLAVNLVGWVLAVLLVYMLTLQVTGQRSAAFWAALFSVSGMGFASHAQDYSAHLLAFTFYFAAIYFVYDSQVWREAR